MDKLKMSKYALLEKMQEIFRSVFNNVIYPITIVVVLVFFINDKNYIWILTLIAELIISVMIDYLFERKLKRMRAIIWMLEELKDQQEASQLIMLPISRK